MTASPDWLALRDRVRAEYTEATDAAGRTHHGLRLLGLLGRMLADGQGDASTEALLDESVELARDLLAAGQLTGERAELVEVALAVDLVGRHRVRGDHASLDEALAIGERRVARDLDVSWATDRINLGSALLTSWETTSRREHLDRAIEVLDPVVSAGRDGEAPLDPEASIKASGNLAAAYASRYDLDRRPDDLRRAIDTNRWALRLADSDPDLAASLAANLAGNLTDSFYSQGRGDDLDEAIRLTDRFAPAESRVPSANQWSALARVLLARYERDRDKAALVAGWEAAANALSAAPRDSPSYWGMLGTAASLEFARYHHDGDLDRLTAAIDASVAAIDAASLDLNTFGVLANQACLALSERYELFGDRADLHEAIRRAEQALVPELRADVNRTLRTNLANAYVRRFGLTEDRADLYTAVRTLRPALDLTPPSPERAGRLNTIGSIYAQLAFTTDNPRQLDRAIDAGREAVSLTAATSPDLDIYQTSLGSWLHERAVMTPDEPLPAMLDEAVRTLEAVTRRLTEPSTLRARALVNLGECLSDRYTHVTGPDPVDLQRACDAWDDALAVRELTTTVVAGQRLGNVAFHFELWPQSHQAFAMALDAARVLTARRDVEADQELARFGVQGTAAAAAAAAAHYDDRLAAVVDLEQASATLLAHRAGRAADQVAFADIVARADALGGPMVYWATTRGGGNAFVVRPDGGVGLVELAVTTDLVGQALDTVRAAFAGPSSDPWDAWNTAVAELLSWTWRHLVEPVTDQLAGVPAVGLVPVGRTAWLPLATARPAGGGGLVDATVPHTLTNARSMSTPMAWPTRPRALVAAHPGTGRLWLPDALAEADAVAREYDGRATRLGPTPGPRSSVAPRPSAGWPKPARTLRTCGPVTAVDAGAGDGSGADAQETGNDTDAARLLVEAMAGVDVVHLVCHVDVDFDDPMASLVRLASGVRLGELFDRRLAGQAHLVLSGCDAGLTGTRLPDEAIGPAAVLLAAGARSVTAPLWPLDDQTSGAFMTRYHRLMAAGTDPARALAMAQRAARGESPLVWSSLVHFGV
jgi:hypothetical protein